MAIPPWIRSTDVLGAISSGTNAGLRLRGIQDEEEQQQQNNELRAKQIDAATALRQSNMSAMSNYRNQQIQDAKQRIADQEAKAQAADVLRKHVSDSTTSFLKAVHGGKDPVEALSDNAGADLKVANELITNSLKAKSAANKPPKAPHIDITSPDGKMRAIGLELDNPLLNQWGGTNASTLGTNRVNAAAALTPRAKPQDPFSIPANAAAYANSGADVAPIVTPPVAQPDLVFVRDPKTGKMVLKSQDANSSTK